MANRMTTDPNDIRKIIDKCDACFIGMIDKEGKPYVLPFNFGYEAGIIYFHSDKSGQKMEVLENNPNVCVAFSTDHKLFHRHEPVACSYGMRYRSVLAYGKVEFIEEYGEKERILNIFMKKYAGREFSFNEPAVKNVAIFRLVPDKIHARESGY